MASYKTNQQSCLLKFLKAHPREPMTVHEMYRRMGQEHPVQIIPGESTIYRLLRKFTKEGLVRKSVDKRKQEIERRHSELDTLIQSAYEHMVLGKVPEDVCIKLIEKYQTESKQLQTELDVVKERLSTIHQDERDVDEFIRRLKKYAGFETLTREMLIELVEYIVVDDAPKNKNEPRTVHIYYKFLDKALSNKLNALI